MSPQLPFGHWAEEVTNTLGLGGIFRAIRARVYDVSPVDAARLTSENAHSHVREYRPSTMAVTDGYRNTLNPRKKGFGRPNSRSGANSGRNS